VSRVQLALNVADIDAAVEFYSKLFGTEPAKRRPGYANFAVETPPLKLVLIESADARADGVAGALNHLGVEVDTPAEVEAATARLAGEGLGPRVQESTTCCYAVQDKAWVTDPDGAPWEVYTVLADAPDQTTIGCSAETCGPGAGEPVALAPAVPAGPAPSCC
jgi:catechol 2,3-dioxygenase-like lactoylglutathione lyase family enzyme